MGEPSLNHDQAMALAVIAAIVIALLAANLWARRQHLAYTLRKLLAAVIGGLLMYGAFMIDPRFQPAAPFIGVLVGILLFSLRPRRKRGMRAEARRRVIAKWIASTGKKYNPRIHEVDHIIPFAKGGSDTEDNLRVIEKKANRSKGAKGPWWDLMGR